MERKVNNHEQEAQKCVFCDIVSGKAESSKISETEASFAFMAMEGHTIVIPKKHIGENEVNENLDSLIQAIELASKLIEPTKKALGATAINLIVNIGKDAGQRVDHAHVHVIDRKPGDKKAIFPYIPALSRTELNKRAEDIRIRANLDKA
ncbi:MAG: HIT family protein [Candidatus Levybacteria bacterium]|nr:HIT family protein [Candidatus Levybacteria bacterium]